MHVSLQLVVKLPESDVQELQDPWWADQYQVWEQIWAR